MAGETEKLLVKRVVVIVANLVEKVVEIERTNEKIMKSKSCQ